MDRETLTAIVNAKRELDGIPVVANMDFGHTDPLLTIPVGGYATVAAGPTGAMVTLQT